MKCRELIEILERLAPPALACEWDNVGLLAGRWDREVQKILVALDATDQVIDQAEKWGADFLLTHHPLIFKPLKRIDDGDFIARRVMRLIRSDISYYAMHTNFDAAPGGMADLAAARLRLSHCRVLEALGRLPAGEEGAHTGKAEIEYGIGRTGYLPCPMTVKELAGAVKLAFGLPFVTVYGEQAAGEAVEYAAVSPGSGRGSIPYALEAGASVLITGDIGHHEGIDAAARNLAVIDAGHYGLEHIFSEFMRDFLNRELGGRAQAKAAETAFPAAVR